MQKPRYENQYCNGCLRTTKHRMDSERNRAICTACSREMTWHDDRKKKR